MKKTARKRAAPRTQPLSKRYMKYFMPCSTVVPRNADSPNDLRQPPALKPVPSVVTYGVEEQPIMQ